MQLIGRVEPAARQGFSGGEVHFRYSKFFRFLQLLSGMELIHDVGFHHGAV